jgi:hypothetical protein
MRQQLTKNIDNINNTKYFNLRAMNVFKVRTSHKGV